MNLITSGTITILDYDIIKNLPTEKFELLSTVHEKMEENNFIGQLKEIIDKEKQKEKEIVGKEKQNEIAEKEKQTENIINFGMQSIQYGWENRMISDDEKYDCIGSLLSVVSNHFTILTILLQQDDKKGTLKVIQKFSKK
jgi:hypothetical protein